MQNFNPRNPKSNQPHPLDNPQGAAYVCINELLSLKPVYLLVICILVLF